MTLRTKFSLGATSLLATSLFLVALPAAAQVDGEVSIQRFDPAPGTKNFFTTRSAEIDGQFGWTAGAFVNYGYEPLVVTGQNGDDLSVVESMITGDVLGSFTIIPQLQVGLKVPVSWVNGQGLTDDGLPAPDGLNAVGLGDIQLEVKGRFYGDPGDLIVLGAYGYAGFPTGHATASGSYIGNSSASFGGAFIGSGTWNDLTYGVNLGGIWREETTIGNASLGAEARWGVGAGYGIGPLLRVVVDAFGSTNFTGDNGGNNIELDGGVQITPLGMPLTVSAGGGVGLLKGIGIPTARGFLGVIYSSESTDRDQDGVSDDADACPDDPEDKDGYEDGDGCPEEDNDLDGLPDTDDKCPDKAEDVDGFEDKDGCPEEDNDKDGIPDPQDHCPDQAETMNDIDDLDGCPDATDTDNDGVPDESDKCPEAAEDTDGFEDTDGCPDPDNDGDGIPDNQDECIDEPEDKKGNAYEKKDGCPFDA